MDALAGLLDGPRARGAFLLRAVMAPPWSVLVQDRAPLAAVALVAGEAWIRRTGEPDRRLGPGDVALLRGPAPYVFADEPDRPPQVVIHPGQRCTTPHGDDVAAPMDIGVRTWGNDPTGPVTMLIGAYEEAGEVAEPVLRALPPTAVLRAGTWRDDISALLAAEIGRNDPAQEVVLDRLLDLLVIAAVRAWFARDDVEPPTPFRAAHDPVVGRALALLDQHLDAPWTVASLASEVGLSRAALARRFTALVGEPPMAYLTGRRLAMAADLLRRPDTTVAAVADRVGYGSPFALSAAFRRERGVTPTEHRARHRTPAPSA